MTEPGMMNVMLAGFQGIPVHGNPQVSHVNYPVNGPLTLTGKIKSYDPVTGRMQVEAHWDGSSSKLRFNVVAKYRGQEGIPTADEVVIEEECDFHRVGDFNSAGSGPVSGYELRTEDPTKVSWVSFFFKRIPVFAINVLAATPTSILSGTEVAGKVYTTRRSGEKKWFETNLSILRSMKMFGLPGSPFGNEFSTFPEKVLMLENDKIDIFRVTVASCDGIQKAQKIYNIQVVPGEMDGTACYVIFDAGVLDPVAIGCCDE